MAADFEDDDRDDQDDEDFGLGDVITGLWAWVRPYPWQAALLLLCLSANLVATLTIAFSLELIVDEIVPNGDVTLLGRVAAAMALVVAAAFLCSIVQARLVSWLSARVLTDIQTALFDKLTRLPTDYFRRTPRGDILARFSSDISSVASAVGEAAPYLVMYIIMLFGCIGAIAWIDWRAGLATLVLLPLGVALNRIVGKPAASAVRDYKSGEARVVSEAEETLRAHAHVRSFGLHQVFRSRFDRQARSKTERHGRAVFLVHLGEMIVEYGTMFLAALALAGGAWLAITGEVSAGAIVAMFTLLLYLQDTAFEIGTTAANLIEAGGGLQRVGDFLAEPNEDDDDDDQEAAPLEREVRLHGVSFGFQPGEALVEDISFSIRRGQSVALIGRSGSGKSTILNLLLRFFEPLEGHVTWDGQDIRSLSRQSLRAQIGVVFQDPLTVRSTIAEAVRFGRADATDEDIRRALAQAELLAFVAGLPAGTATLIGEGGMTLSGGQRQRLALAQALVRQPSLLVLDEATSALDPETEAKIATTLDNLKGRQTMLFVTHRLSLAQKADRIVVLADGRIAETGSHAELMRIGGVYAGIHARQAGFDVSAHGDVSVSTHHLRSIPLLGGLSADHLETLSGAFTTCSYEQGATIVREGDRADAFYLIHRGQLEVRSGAEVVAVLEDGDHFGEIALILDLPRTASIVTRTPVTCLRLKREDFATLTRSSQALEQLISLAAKDRLAALQAHQSHSADLELHA